MVATTKTAKKPQRNTTALTKKIEKLTTQIQLLQSRLSAASILRETVHSMIIADAAPIEEEPPVVV
jgi:hypothetical protein